MSEHCGSLTEEGAAVCIPGECRCSAETKSSEPVFISAPPLIESRDQETSMRKKIRSTVMFVIACIASPCCTPIIVPIAITLLAGTPIAAWLSAYIGWVYVV